MSLFVASSCQVVGDMMINHLSWSRTDQIAALSTFTVDENDKETSQVLFTNNEGEIIPNSAINHDFEATIFDWHPVDKVVAIGWADGMVSSWVVDGKNRPTSSFSNSTQHNDSITVLKWNPYGKRLVTGDKRGVVVVWSVDSRGAVNPIRQYKRKGTISSLIFCAMPPRAMEVAAVGRGKSEFKTHNYSPSFFFGTDRGAVVYADDLGHCTDVQQLSASIDSMMFFEERSRLIIVTRSLLLTQYHVSDDGRVTRVMQVKLSVPADVAVKGIQSLVWAGPGLLAAATEEKIVRLLDIASDESYNLSLMNALGEMMDRTDKVVCVAFSPIDRYLAVGTLVGVVAIWKYTGPARDVSTPKGSQNAPMAAATSAAEWEVTFKVALNSPVMQLSWHNGRGCLAAVTEDGTVILNESVLHCIMCGDLSVVQISSQEVSLHIGGSPDPLIINTSVQIKGVAVGHSCFVVWTGKVAKVYRVDMHMQTCDLVDTVRAPGVAMAIADASHIVDEAWFIADHSIVKINNFNGTQRGLISFSEAEGQPQHLDVNGKFLAIVTNKGVVKILDVHAPTKPKLLGSAGQLFNSKSIAVVSSIGSSKKGDSGATKASGAGAGRSEGNVQKIRIRSVRVNSIGSMVAVLTDRVEGALQVSHPDTKLYVYDRYKGAVFTFDFASRKRIPLTVFWDEQDDRLFACEAIKQRISLTDPTTEGTKLSISSKKTSKNQSNASLDELDNNPSGEADKNAIDTGEEDLEVESEVEVFLFFATSEHGVMMQDSLPRKLPYGSMIGLMVPRLYFRNAVIARKGEDMGDEEEEMQNTREVKIYSKVMRDFIGMDDVNEMVKTALLDFSFNLTLGKLDEAYRVVKAINNPSVWENMAQMCVKTKRLDVAEVCLGNMGHARGAAAVREAKSQDSGEVSVGVLAIQLGLLDDAATLFREAGRFDLLNNLYQAAGLWEKAVNTATTKDRIHLKTTHYQYAKHLESIGLVDDAIEHYELSENSKTEVPRMLFHLGQVDELGEYVLRSEDPELLKWWAAYLESIERFDKAKKYYSKAKDYLSLVRICCFKGDFNGAADIITDTGDRASAYFFARQLETQGEYQEAINFYASSGCYNHSIRLARAYNLDSELMRYALKSTLSLMIECAVHFEDKGEYDKAVQLYHKGGDIPRALDLCFRVGEDKKNPHANVVFDMLNTIAQDLGADSSPQTLARCAEFLVQHQQFDKAIELYVMAKRYHSAVEMCLQHKVNINDEMVETLTPPEDVDPSERKEILADLAKALKKQGSFTMASKKYTQAGDRIRAIKCLVRSGDTKAVIQFASISRNVEIYKLAANYLQQMNWRESVDIMKAIIMFYSKAKAFMQLAGFYDSCAQVEIDEYRDYEKAIGALKEALKYLGKDKSKAADDMSLAIEKRILMIEKFVQARKSVKKEPATMVAICEALLQEPMLEDAIRAGDCLAMLVEHFHSRGQMQDAYQYLQEMDSRNIQLHPYVDTAIISEIYKAVGVNPNGGGRKARSNTVDSEKGSDSKMDDDDDDVMGHGEPAGTKMASQDDEEDLDVDEEIDEEIVEEDEEDMVPTKASGSKFGRGAGSGGFRGGGRNGGYGAGRK